MSNLLLDTCTIVWAILEPSRLSKPAAAALEDPDAVIQFLPMSVAEVACAVERGRLELKEHWRLWFRRHVDANGWTCVPIDMEIVEEAYSLPPPIHDDPADRLLIAAARIKRCVVVTGDAKILAYPHVRTIW